MDTQLVDEIYIEKDELIDSVNQAWIDFLDGDKNTIIEDTYQKAAVLLLNTRWVVMEDDWVYDNKIKASWLGLCNDKYTHQSYLQFNTGTKAVDALKDIRAKHKTKQEFDIATKDELFNSLTNMSIAPFALNSSNGKKWPIITDNAIYLKNDIVQGYYIDYDLKDIDAAIIIPLLRLTSEDNFEISDREVFFRWVILGLVPKDLKDDESYTSFINSFTYDVDDFFDIQEIKLKEKGKIFFSAKEIVNKLLNEDKVRADIESYNHKIVEDTDLGHWSLFENREDFKEPIALKLGRQLVARDPASSINDGMVGIDFGTKSTVVVYQKNNVNIHPMRVGTGELSREIESYHYENPTIMEFNDLDAFITSYNEKEHKPNTKWSDITISHTAYNSMMGSSSDKFNTFLDELKQWAGDENRKLKIVGKQGKVIDLPPFLELKDDDVNPIEIYAYYLGLYINNQNNGIYLNYALSFPVTYSVAIQDKIIESFKKGILKSLPPQLNKIHIDKLDIQKGASEPAAYAVVALKEYGFEPEDGKRVFYGVFDFGGGTTDFDFGIYRDRNGAKEKRYDYVIEHFGAGGDRFLGGENLLELLAFEIFKKNKSVLLEKSIQFEKHPERDEFAGSEKLLAYSQEAKMNTKNLCEQLRPFWEQHEDKKEDFNNNSLSLNLTDITGTSHAGFELEIEIEELEALLYKRIEQGIVNFFESLRQAFTNKSDLGDIDTINIFLAGNSSKSQYVRDIFYLMIVEERKKMEEQSSFTVSNEIFKIFEPLGSDSSNVEKPTGKTGVAFGLIESRKGGKIKVINHNIEDNEIRFKYYLGESRKGKFKTVVDRETPYSTWIAFIDASEDRFELYYTMQPTASTNSMQINDNNIKKLMLKIDKTDEDAMVYVRAISPTKIEYVVALEDEIKSSNYMTDIITIILD